MATMLAECDRMIAAARESGKRLLIAHNQRVWNIHKLARELLEDWRIGKPIGVGCRKGAPLHEGDVCYGRSGKERSAHLSVIASKKEYKKRTHHTAKRGNDVSDFFI